MRRVTVALLLLVLPPSSVMAATDPLAGPNRFPQFRHLSGLSGAGFGVDIEGNPSPGGPVAFSTPVGHVLGHDNWRIAGSRTSFGRRPNLGTNRTNSTLMVAYGHTFGSVNVMASDLVLSRSGDHAFNVQAQYTLPGALPLALSVGVQDIDGGGGSSGEDIEDDLRSSTSVFGVATYAVQGLPRPLHVSAGIGGRRFSKGFGSASYQVADPLRLWAEHDGFGLNAGVVYTTMAGKGPNAVEVNVLAGAVSARHFTFAVGVGF